MKPDLDPARLTALVQNALQEDWGAGGDITTDSTIDPASTHTTVIASRQHGVVAGLELARLAFHLTDATLRITAEKQDGDAVQPGEVIARLSGSTASLLKGERVALNFLTHLSGIATLTARYVKEVQGTRAKITDTRKTLPGLRDVQKYAVRMGGGKNHRFTLDEAVLIKDNHIAGGGGIAAAVQQARAYKNYRGLIEVETDSLDQVKEALAAKADIIMLDNFSPQQVRDAAALIGGRAIIDVSGGIQLSNVRAYAEAGADIISIGALTHSAPSLDLGLDF